jgi:exopolysaccharide production protein ExoQ
MNRSFLQYLETAIVVLLLIFCDSFKIPGNIEAIIKLTTYILVGFLVIRQPLERLFQVAFRDVLLLILVLFTCASVLWSNDVDVTLDQLKALLRAIVLGVYLATRYTRREQMQILAIVLGITSVLSLLAGLLFPGDTIVVANHILAWQGIYGHKQYFARAMVIGAMTFLLLASDRTPKRFLYIGFFGLCLSLIWLSTSRSAMALALLAVILLPLYNVLRMHFKLRTAILICVFMVIGFVLFTITTNLETLLVDVMGKDLELNGRTPLWQRAIEVGLQRPWLGYGYAAFWATPISYEVSRYLWVTAELSSAHSHNGFIDTFLQIGVIGLVLFVVHFISVLVRVVRLAFENASIENIWMMQMLLLMLLYNLIEMNTILNGQFLWIYYVAFSVTTAQKSLNSVSKTDRFIVPSLNYKTEA